MGVVGPGSPAFGQDDDHGPDDLATQVLPAGQSASGAVRSWLVSGARAFAVDPRRRFGVHGSARSWLAEDRGSVTSGRGTWRQLVSALQRQTVHNGLAHLTAEERQVITLAYLEGRTNPQIADLLGVSVSTVRRRLWLALDHLEQYVRRSGTWVSSLLVVGLAYGFARAAGLGRAISVSGSSDWVPKVGATLAAATMTTAAVGLVAPSLVPASTTHSRPTVARAHGPLVRAISQVPFNMETPSEAGEDVAGAGAGKPAGQAPGANRDRGREHAPKAGCPGRPSNGPPAVVVGPPDAQPAHRAGGCKPTRSPEVIA